MKYIFSIIIFNINKYIIKNKKITLQLKLDKKKKKDIYFVLHWIENPKNTRVQTASLVIFPPYNMKGI